MLMDMGKFVRSITQKCRSAAWPIIPVLRLHDRLSGGALRTDMETNISLYCTEQQRRDRAFMRRTRRDMWYSFIVYDCPFQEYFMFRFPLLSHQGRKEFVTDFEKKRLCKTLSSKQVRDIFWNKWLTYERFRPYYRRDAMLIDGNTTLEQLSAFAQKHPRFIIKPCEDAGGHGISAYDTRTDGRTLAQLLEQLRGQNMMLEEPIVQSEALARPHPQSVNTIRCATFLKDGQADILFTFYRTGRGGSVVDNGAAGGFVATVDVDTGIVDSPGVTETLFSALVHPDTGVPIIGLRVPRWEEMKAFAKELALVCPELPYNSWDLALTDDGWVMVEGNAYGQFIGPQYPAWRGIRAKLAPYFDL